MSSQANIDVAFAHAMRTLRILAGLSLSAILTACGGGSGGGGTPESAPVPASDTTPNAFSFTDQSNVATATVITSAPVSITGISAAAPISVTGGSYSIDCTGTFTSTAGTITNGHTVCVRHTSSATNATTTSTVLTVGGRSDTFTSTTAGAADTTPNAFTFIDQVNVSPSTVITSAPVSIAGITAAAPISVTGGSYSIDCTGTFTTAAGTITNGHTVCARHTSAAASGTATNTVITVGGVADTFTSTTIAADTTPNAFSFIDQVNVTPSTVITSAAISITGINAAAPISITGGTYSIGCGATYTASAGTIANGQAVCVRHTSAATSGTATNTVLTVGGVSDTFTSTTTAVIGLSGTIHVPVGNFLDGDNNDPGNPYHSNDSEITAQTVPNPVTVGGYINEQFTGPSGPSYNVGDNDDYYRVNAVAGQVISLAIADYLDADLDLYLEDSSGFIVDASVGTSLSETLVIPATGTYYVNVHQYSLSFGASKYTLTIGSDPGTAAASQGALRLGDAFIPGDLLVRQKVADKVAPTPSALAATLGLERQAGADNRIARFHMTNGAAAEAQDRPAQAARAAVSPERRFRNTEDREKWQTLMAIKALRREPTVQYAEPNVVVQAAAIPNDPYYPRQWHYPLINLPAAWDITVGTSGVVVAVVDTGVVLTHPDLQGQLVAGYDFVSDPASAADGNGIDSNPSDPGDNRLAGASTFHGTHVTGTIAASTNNFTGVAGVAAGARVMPVRVLGAAGGTYYDVIQGVRFAGGLSNDSGTVPAQPAAIINLSLGGAGACSQAVQDTINQVRAAGAIIVAAAGNDSSSGAYTPASCSGVVSVSAVGSNKSLASYSNFGPTVDIAAPGGDSLGSDLNGDGSPDLVWSTSASDGVSGPVPRYDVKEGTSMATPHVSGVIALMKSVNPGLTPAAVDQLLANGALTEDLGAPGRDDQYGYGLINARKAVEAALGGAPALPARLDTSVANINFGDTQSVAQVSVSNAGSGALQVTGSSSDQPWLHVAAASVNGSGLGTYTISVTRSGLAAGTYTGHVTWTSSANTVTIPVLLSVSSSASVGNVGVLSVLLLDGTTGDTVDFRSVTSTTGEYAFNFANVQPGVYVLAAGTDLDNDNYVCSPSEACGAYPTIDQYRIITVSNQSLSGLDFSAGFAPYFFSNQLSTGSRSPKILNTAQFPTIPAGWIAR